MIDDVCLAARSISNTDGAPFPFSARAAGITTLSSLSRPSEPIGNGSAGQPSASLPSTFTDSQHGLRQWLEHVEHLLLNDKVRLVDSQAINGKKNAYKDLLDQTYEQEQLMETLTETARDYYPKLTMDTSRRLQEELSNYQDRLYDVKMFLSERLAKYNRVDQTLNDFEVRTRVVVVVVVVVYPPCSSREAWLR